MHEADSHKMRSKRKINYISFLYYISNQTQNYIMTISGAEVKHGWSYTSTPHMSSWRGV
jgi:hypothetical protein